MINEYLQQDIAGSNLFSRSKYNNSRQRKYDDDYDKNKDCT